MRWIGIALAIGLAAIALVTLVRSERTAQSSARHESIDDASRAELEAVLRKSGAGEASP
ncbi:MAG: hypothetical protein MUF70_14805 [Myxococcota bacterium]|jgi:hypothetical protein|nr:hypothetical protein [Myxococcota bacterium]